MKYGVTIVREGYVEVEASSPLDAQRKANQLRTQDVLWDDDWEAYDAYELEEMNHESVQPVA